MYIETSQKRLIPWKMDVDRDRVSQEPRIPRITTKTDPEGQKDALFNELFNECRRAAPGARLALSCTLRNRLARLSVEERQEVVTKKREGCAPLFVACKRGNVEIVEYLIVHCKADVEQRGQYEVPDDRSVHCVTPLWCAAVSGKLCVVKCLVQHGAKVDSLSDTGSTPVRSACFMTHIDVVEYLVKNGADVLRPNYNGGTCLINSVQSGVLCDLLLSHGAAVNAQDIQQKTALHYAVQEHRFETTRLLLEHGADPFLKSRYNDDALQTACLKGATQIFEFLVSVVPYDVERVADAYELIGTTFLDEQHEIQLALESWRKAVQLREESGLVKRVAPPRSAYQNMLEFGTLAELNNVAHDLDALRVQSLIVCERILGSTHKDMIFRLMYRGAAYADALQYQRCIDLWRYALELRSEKDSILYSDTCFTARALVRLFLDLHEKHTANICHEALRFDDVLATTLLIHSQLHESKQLLRVQPVHRRQQESFDGMLRCLTHLLHLLLETCRTEQHRTDLRSAVKLLLTCDPRTGDGCSLLHLSVHKSNLIRCTYFTEDHQVAIFPSFSVTNLLVDCGADVNAVNHTKSTPLHVAATSECPPCEIVRFLLDHDAHLDQVNMQGMNAHRLLRNSRSDINLLQYSSLKCMAALVVAEHDIPYKGEVPVMLETFIELHR